MPTLNETNSNHSRITSELIMSQNSNDSDSSSNNNKSIFTDLTSVPMTNINNGINNNNINVAGSHNNNNINNNNNNNDVIAPINNIHQANKHPSVPTVIVDTSNLKVSSIESSRKELKEQNARRYTSSNSTPTSNNQASQDFKIDWSVLTQDIKTRRKYYQHLLRKIDSDDAYNVKDRAQVFDELSCNECLEYDKVNGACCENVVGYVKVPLGVAGPLKLDGKDYLVPLATTKGFLVAHALRGMSALRDSGGVISTVRRDFMTRAPIVRFQNREVARQAVDWLTRNFDTMKSAFDATSSHAKLLRYTTNSIDEEVHIRFEAHTGDAMGMNMCSKGAESALKRMLTVFPRMEIVALSGNMCTDKKSAAINFINGRGKEVECAVRIPEKVLMKVFNLTVDKVINRSRARIKERTMPTGHLGSFNCQAASVVAAIFIATGQDPAQNVTSSNCNIFFAKNTDGSLQLTCLMPSIECGTVGGGTILSDQSRNLQMMGIKGATPRQTKMYDDGHNSNACTLARVICATVMAAELSSLANLVEHPLTNSIKPNSSYDELTPSTFTQRAPHRSIEELSRLIPSLQNFDYSDISVEELAELAIHKKIPIYALESRYKGNNAACVKARRLYYQHILNNHDGNDEVDDRAKVFQDAPIDDISKFDETSRSCCENVIGYVKVPLGIAGSVIIGGTEFFVPLATTEGCLVASTMRGMSAMRRSGGVRIKIHEDRFIRINASNNELSYIANNVLTWIEDNITTLSLAFDTVSEHIKFHKCTSYFIERGLHISFEAHSGDTMDMSSFPQAVNKALEEIQKVFPQVDTGCETSNGKFSNITTISEFPKEAEVYVEIPASEVLKIFKVSVDSMIDRWNSKIMKGSVLAGCPTGGFNCQAANIVTAIFIATGQDSAHNVLSSNCFLFLEKGQGGSLRVECRMPTVECVTSGSGTVLKDQGRNLQMMGLKNIFRQSTDISTSRDHLNEQKLAYVICASVMAAELSLLAALTEGTLVKSHMRHNRSSTNVTDCFSSIV